MFGSPSPGLDLREEYRRRQPLLSALPPLRKAGIGGPRKRLAQSLTAPRIDALLRRWLARLPHPYRSADRGAGIRYQVAILRACRRLGYGGSFTLIGSGWSAAAREAFARHAADCIRHWSDTAYRRSVSVCESREEPVKAPPRNYRKSVPAVPSPKTTSADESGAPVLWSLASRSGLAY